MSQIQLFDSEQNRSSKVAIKKPYLVLIAAFICVAILNIAHPALAHHAIGGSTPTNFFEGFISGLAHPVIGIDHFAFIVAIGLISAGRQNGFLIPSAFVLAAMAGTGIHVFGLDLPYPEIVIAVSVITFGVMLVLSKKQNWLLITSLGAVAGLFHGYAYGESIVGAQMTPLIAYLAGFTVIQYGIAIAALRIAQLASQKSTLTFSKVLKFIGLAICSVGVVFLTTSITG